MFDQLVRQMTPADLPGQMRAMVTLLEAIATDMRALRDQSGSQLEEPDDYRIHIRLDNAGESSFERSEQLEVERIIFSTNAGANTRFWLSIANDTWGAWRMSNVSPIVIPVGVIVQRGLTVTINSDTLEAGWAWDAIVVCKPGTAPARRGGE